MADYPAREGNGPNRLWRWRQSPRTMHGAPRPAADDAPRRLASRSLDRMEAEPARSLVRGRASLGLGQDFFVAGPAQGMGHRVGAARQSRRGARPRHPSGFAGTRGGRRPDCARDASAAVPPEAEARSEGHELQRQNRPVSSASREVMVVIRSVPTTSCGARRKLGVDTSMRRRRLALLRCTSSMFPTDPGRR